MKKYIAVIAALFISVGSVRADIDIDLGDLGVVSLKTAVIPAAKVLFDTEYPPDRDEDGNVIVKTTAEYIQNMQDYILAHGWITLTRNVAETYWTLNPPSVPDINQYMTLTPASP